MKEKIGEDGEPEPKNILIVTNRPATSTSWYKDYEKFLGLESGFRFISEDSNIKHEKLVLSRKDYNNLILEKGEYPPYIEFISLQDLKGSKYFGGTHDKLGYVKNVDWDLVIIDEAHEGVDTFKTDVAFSQIKRDFTLHLSGTPFKALASKHFEKDAIYNWTYADEQNKKREFQEKADREEIANPYTDLPKLNMFTYRMSDIIADEIDKGMELEGETVEYAFDLNEFFKTKENGKFEHEESVDRFLDALTTQKKFPFSTEELRDELKHTFWILDRVDSAKALKKKLDQHPVFQDYEVILAAGDGRIDENESAEKSYKKVTEAIKKHDKTITLSVGQLTTGVTIPEWTGVLMLANVKSPSLYMQAAFRAQNPLKYTKDGVNYRKENAYLFDFDPARTLQVYEQFANDLIPKTNGGGGTAADREANIKELLNFFPVIGEDENGEMIELDAESVLSIPRKIYSEEVVRRGFMSDFLFQNITNVFHAPKEIIEIIGKFEPQKEPKEKIKLPDDETRKKFNFDDEGHPVVNETGILLECESIFGPKVYDEVKTSYTDTIEKEIQKQEEKPRKKNYEGFKSNIVDAFSGPLMNQTKEVFKGDIHGKAQEKNLEKIIKDSVEGQINKIFVDYQVEHNQAVKDSETEYKAAKTEEEKKQVEEESRQKIQEINEKLEDQLEERHEEIIAEASKEAVKQIETVKLVKEQDQIESGIKDHLRGFSRTIPSFLMAYGDENTTLESFDKIVPDEVFQEVTGITLNQFRLLRDGGEIKDADTGEIKDFYGHLFDEVVFNDAVKNFLHKKEELSDYFDESASEDIFDFIPPQKTNQIFTPKWVVKKMVDELEEQSPGCFDDPEKTFLDPYMKSGLYPAEIIKRLYRSEKMKAAFPDEEERLKHIIENQVYGLAPTEIIYEISKNFILGSEKMKKIEKNNFRKLDALPYVKEGTLSEELDKLFPERAE